MLNKPTSLVGNPIIRGVTVLLLAPILLFALYVQWHGDYGPGGGFQAGVIFAVAIIAHALIFGVRATQRMITPYAVRVGAVIGWMLYLLTGVVSMLRGAEFLNYSVLVHDPLHGQHYGILTIELGVGITVASVMIMLFYSFVGGGRNT